MLAWITESRLAPAPTFCARRKGGCSGISPGSARKRCRAILPLPGRDQPRGEAPGRIGARGKDCSSNTALRRPVGGSPQHRPGEGGHRPGRSRPARADFCQSRTIARSPRLPGSALSISSFIRRSRLTSVFMNTDRAFRLVLDHCDKLLVRRRETFYVGRRVDRRRPRPGLDQAHFAKDFARVQTPDVLALAP